jgi:hypothetical protein
MLLLLYAEMEVIFVPNLEEKNTKNSVEHTRSLEASTLSASNVFPAHCLMEEAEFPCSQKPATCPYPEPDYSSRHFHILFISRKF